jgi:hypothetical protein
VQAFQQLGGIQHGIGTFRLQTSLQSGPPMSGATAQQQNHQLEIAGVKPAPGVRTNHG